MAQTRTAKGTAAAKSSGTTLTIPNVSMNGGDYLVVAVAWDVDEEGNPDVKYGNNLIDFMGGVTTTIGNKRVRVVGEIINNTRTADITVTWDTAITTRAMIAVSLHQAGKLGKQQENENAAATLSTSGPATNIIHIQTLCLAFHLTEGPSGDSIGSSTTGFTMGQRVGTTGDADTTNVTLQEAYEIIAASTVAAGSFVVDDVYQIKTIGTTDFTAIGAASNTVGVQFIATGVGSGTGDAYLLEDNRSRITGLTSRDHVGILFFMQPKRTYTIKQMLQYNRNVNQHPDWVMIEVEDDNDRGFWMRIDPDLFDDWSDTVIDEYVAKFCSVWEVNIYDDNLLYEANSTRNTRMATFVDKAIIL